MPSRTEQAAGVRLGDIAVGDGFIGVVTDLPGGRVGLALFGEPSPSDRSRLWTARDRDIGR